MDWLQDTCSQRQQPPQLSVPVIPSDCSTNFCPVIIHNFIRHQRQQQQQKTNKTKKNYQNKTLQDKSNTTRQHDSILGLILVSIFSTQSTNDIIGYGELTRKIRFYYLCTPKVAENWTFSCSWSQLLWIWY